MLDRAIVHDNRDPSKSGRIKVMIPARSGSGVSDWIWPVVSSGFLVLPMAGEQVWVSYEGDDKDFPVWIGKTATTGQYKNQSKTNVGSVETLLERVKELETEVSQLKTDVNSLKSRVSALESAEGGES